jgi:hypothetical protein
LKNPKGLNECEPEYFEKCLNLITPKLECKLNEDQILDRCDFSLYKIESINYIFTFNNPTGLTESNLKINLRDKLVGDSFKQTLRVAFIKVKPI